MQLFSAPGPFTMIVKPPSEKFWLTIEMGKHGNLPVTLPKLNVVPVNQLLGVLHGRAFIRAN
ncbi:hypothetical protein JQ634_25915 [Bradyrhizobium sp. AUGA SZCCT0240]|uniref:hypothetical protein n=1 Tax=unclassified Bradyrhizobium TaxID=2631580 RepID=UPI001BABE673|nr:MULTISPECIES: hypothetical protein [unclassified Bradyrhizobium]MBR1196591.1 hypothetical protein [Bradyrhizobium sp. AUGA SZCCT0158]MBR1242339.1 hypothetical protein [Bradyrhizobium sp. AUGA SZCCT0274]MBR1257116.1 hypothetical protein [Bradyrhizobium sp. AUGA SZCCT0240]